MDQTQQLFESANFFPDQQGADQEGGWACPAHQADRHQPPGPLGQCQVLLEPFYICLTVSARAGATESFRSIHIV